MNSLKIKKGLNLIKSDRLKHLESLKKILANKTHWDSFQFMYDNLNIIDSKSSALLVFNTLIITVLAIWTENAKLSLLFYIYIIILLLFLVSSLLCLLTVFLHWSSTSDFENPEYHIDLLLQVREKRTLKYRYAWYLAFLGIFFILATKIIEVFVI